MVVVFLIQTAKSCIEFFLKFSPKKVERFGDEMPRRCRNTFGIGERLKNKKLALVKITAVALDVYPQQVTLA